MKIIIFSTAYHPYIGGAEVAIREITNRLEEHEFHMLTPLMDRGLKRKEKIGNITVYRIGIGIPTFDKFYFALRGHTHALFLHRDHKYDLAWSMMASFSGFAALSFKQKSNIPFLLTLQEGDPIEYILKKVRFVRKRFNNIFKQADGLQAISNYLMNWGQEMGFKGKISEVVPNGVDIERFTKDYSKQELKQTRDSFGFSQNAIVLVTASRLVVKNGIEHVIIALTKLPKEVCFVICGSGELETPLKDLVTKLNLSDRVKFLGNVNHQELPKILKSSDIAIRPSITEGLGNAFLESMAAGLPTIGTEVGGIPDFLIDGKTGFFCKPENPDSIAITVQKIRKLTDQEKQTIHQNAMKIIKEKYNWTYVTKRMRDIFSKLMKT